MRRALEAGADTARIAPGFARVPREQRRRREVPRHVEHLYALKPHDTAVKIQLARVRARARDFAGAAPLLQELLAGDPANAEAHYWLAWSFIGLERPERAAEYAQLAAQLTPDKKVVVKMAEQSDSIGGQRVSVKLDLPAV